MANKTLERWGERATGSAAASDLVAKRFINGTGYAGRGDKADGVSVLDADSGDEVSLHVSGDVNVTANGTVTSGDEVTSDANGKAIKKYPDRIVKKKSSTENKSEDTTLADDAELKAITLAKGLIYKITGRVAVTNQDDSSARSIKYKFDVPSGTTAKGKIVGAAAVDGNVTMADENADLTAEQTHQVSADESGFVGFEGYFDMTSIANETGNVAFQWAASASVTHLIGIQEGSLIEFEANDIQAINGIAKSTNTDGDVLVRLNK